MEERDVGKYTAIDTASYTRILEFSSRVLLEPQRKFLFLMSCSKIDMSCSQSLLHLRIE